MVALFVINCICSSLKSENTRNFINSLYGKSTKCFILKRYWLNIPVHYLQRINSFLVSILYSTEVKNFYII